MPLEHCPSPWVVRERDDDPGWYEIDHDGNGSLECRLSKEDVEFIVRACNAAEAAEIVAEIERRTRELGLVMGLVGKPYDAEIDAINAADRATRAMLDRQVVEACAERDRALREVTRQKYHVARLLEACKWMLPIVEESMAGQVFAEQFTPIKLAREAIANAESVEWIKPWMKGE